MWYNNTVPDVKEQKEIKENKNVSESHLPELP
jgi:hypothetical protein